MSAGGFVTAVYESDAGYTYLIRVQPETLTLSSGNVSNKVNIRLNEVTVPLFVHAKGSRRSIFPCARTATFVWKTPESTGGGSGNNNTTEPQPDAPENYKKTGKIILPIVKKQFYETLNAGTEVPYLGKTLVCVSKTPEKGFPGAIRISGGGSGGTSTGG